MKGYDYSQGGAYFVTVCTQFREPLLDPDPARQIIQKMWDDLENRFPNIRLDEFVIMPNHVHGVIWIVGAPLGAPQNGWADAPPNDINMPQDDIGSVHQGAASSAPTVGRVVRAFKSISAIAINRHLDRVGNPVWQRNYYERIIRNDGELDRIRQYIRDNPGNWDQDPENPEFW